MGTAAVAAFALPTAAWAVVLDFDGIATFDAVDGYYAGGTSSGGQTGPDFGIVFQAGDWITADNFGTSSPNIAFSESGNGYVNVDQGFTSLRFTYGTFSDVVLSVYSGTDRTGSLLAAVVVPMNDPAAYDAFIVNFTGIARSFGVSGAGGTFGFDDVNIGLIGGIPEPATWAMMILGFGVVGGAMRAGGAARRSGLRFA